MPGKPSSSSAASSSSNSKQSVAAAATSVAPGILALVPTASNISSASATADAASAKDKLEESSQWRMNEEWGKILKYILDNNLIHKPHQVYDNLPSLGIQPKGNYNAFSNQWHTRKKNLVQFAAAYEELYNSGSGASVHTEINESFLKGSHLLKKYAKKFDSDPITALKLGRALKASGLLSDNGSTPDGKRSKRASGAGASVDDTSSVNNGSNDQSSSDLDTPEAPSSASPNKRSKSFPESDGAQGESTKQMRIKLNRLGDQVKELSSEMKELKETLNRTCAAVEKLAASKSSGGKN